jgi:hypothetical protein
MSVKSSIRHEQGRTFIPKCAAFTRVDAIVRKTLPAHPGQRPFVVVTVVAKLKSVNAIVFRIPHDKVLIAGLKPAPSTITFTLSDIGEFSKHSASPF